MKYDDSSFTCSKCDKCLENGYSMACLHMICRECFDVQDTTESHTCDICHVSHDKSAISNIDNLIAWNNAKRKKKIECTGCSENLSAVYHCQQCDDDLCSNCASAHGRVKFTKDHQLSEHEKPSNNFCSSHRDSKAEFFCLTCESSFCVYCFLLNKHPAAGNHRFCTDLEIRLLLVQRLALSNEQCFKEVEQLLTISHQLLAKLSRTGEEYHKNFDRSKAEILPTPNFLAFDHLRRLLTAKIGSQNANFLPTSPPQNAIPLLPGIFAPPPDLQYAVSSKENSQVVGTSPECYEVPNPQQYSPMNPHLPSPYQAFDPSPRIQYGFHTPGVYNDQFGAQSPMRHFLNQRFPACYPSPGTTAIYPVCGYTTSCLPGGPPPPPLMPNFPSNAPLRQLPTKISEPQPSSKKCLFLENQVKKRRRGGGAGGQTTGKVTKKNQEMSNGVSLSACASTKESYASEPIQRIAASANDSSQYANIPTSSYCPDDLDNPLIICETPLSGLF